MTAPCQPAVIAKSRMLSKKRDMQSISGLIGSQALRNALATEERQQQAAATTASSPVG